MFSKTALRAQAEVPSRAKLERRPVATNPTFFFPKGISDPYCELRIGERDVRFGYGANTDRFSMLSNEYRVSYGARRQSVRLTTRELEDLLLTVQASIRGDTPGSLNQFAEIIQNALNKRPKLENEFPLSPDWIDAHLQRLAGEVSKDQRDLRKLSDHEKDKIRELTAPPTGGSVQVHRHHLSQWVYDQRSPPGAIANDDYKLVPLDRERPIWT